MKIVYGRSGYGKSYYCMNEIKQNIEASFEGPLLYIVPEQFSLSAEMDLSKLIGRGGIIKAEVVTFKRLCHRVYNEFGFRKTAIGSSAKNMLLYYLMSKNDSKLHMLKGVDKNPGLVKTVSDFISECKRYHLTPEILKAYEPKTELFRLKLQDLVLLYESFEEHMNVDYVDKDDEFTNLTSLIPNSIIVKGARIWIDGFDGFTPQELNLIFELEKVADVTVSLTLDDTDEEMFLLNKKTYQKLSKECEVKTIYLKEPKRFHHPELVHLEANYNKLYLQKYEEEVKNISITMESNLHTEIESVAKSILKEVRENHLRYENIAIVTRNLEDYKNEFKMIFPKYHIPYFFDDKHELAAQPLVMLVTSLLDICSKNFSYEEVFHYLKTCLSNIKDVNDIDLLENYVLEWGIKYNGYLKEWTYGKGDLEKVNSIRRALVEPILSFKSQFEKSKTVKDITTAIFTFLKNSHVYEFLLEKAGTIQKKENPTQSELDIAYTYLQVWNIFMRLLDELVMVLGNETVSFEQFKNILKQGISEYQIGILPTTRDHVLVGDVSRTRNSNIKVSFVIGLNDGIFPSPYNDEGFINDRERNELLENGIEMAKDSKLLLLDEIFHIYKVLTTPSDRLYLSYPVTSSEGTSLRPSEVIQNIKRIFSNISTKSHVMSDDDLEDDISTVEATLPTLLKEIRDVANQKRTDIKLKELTLWYQENCYDKISFIDDALHYQNTLEYISRQNVQKLYGNEMNTSVSKLETFAKCPFQFYLKYGLNVNDRKVYKLETPDVGLFLHEIIEKFSKRILEQGRSFREVEKEEADTLTSQIVEEVLTEFKSSLFSTDSKMKALSLKLKKLVKRMIWTIIFQIKTSDFEVFQSELEFGKDKPQKAIQIELSDGKKVSLSGKIDRVDIAKTEEGKFIRIIDYKSYNKDMKLFHVFEGLEIQMITYMDAVEELEAIPGGILYLKLDNPMLKKDKEVDEKEIEEEIRNMLRMNGMIVANARLFKAMDHMMEPSAEVTSQNLDLEIKKEKITGKTIVPTEEDFALLRGHVRKVLKEMCEEIQKGNIQNKPIRNDGKSPCSYCDYKTVCRFDRNLGNEYRYLEELKNEQVWEQLRIV